MAINERPGVYTSYEVSRLLSGSGAGAAVGIAARTANGSGEMNIIYAYSEAAALYGSASPVTALVRVLLLNGAQLIYIIDLDSAATAADYRAAFDLLRDAERVHMITCDSRSADVHAAMSESINSSPEANKLRIGVVEASGSVTDLCGAASALNNERITLAAPTSGNGLEGAAAAALAAAIVSSPDPALPLNGVELLGLEGITESYADADINTLVRGGVTPLESVGGRVSVIRGVTTRTKTGGVPDTTWRELTTTLIVDDVISTVRNALRAKFSRTKNTAQTRGAIRTQVIIELQNKLAREIVDSYGNVTVTPYSEDPTICEVRFEFTVAHGLNQIYLSASITV